MMLFPHICCENDRALDQVQITGVLMSCVIGIFPSERRRKQPVTIDLCLYLDTRTSASSANIYDTIDYAAALKEVSFILEQCEFLLIETAVEAICKYFLLTYQPDHALPQIEAVVARISKPSALAHGVIPAVQVLRRRADYKLDFLKVKGHTVYNIHKSPDACLQTVVAGDESEINVTELFQSAQAVLTIGKWELQGRPVKSRSSINLPDLATLKPLSNEDPRKSRRILLIHSTL